MPRKPRKKSEADIYHVIVRGEGRQIVFEDDEDRLCFLRMLSASLDKYSSHVFAWCLMSNHAHLLLKADFSIVPRLMQSLTSGYADYFNKQHDHVGHVFAGRYKSEPIDTDEYLMTIVRYIHFNPLNAGLSGSCEYRWSSYSDYLSLSGLTETSFVLEVFGGLGEFVEFHNQDASGLTALKKQTIGYSSSGDDEALEVACSVIGGFRVAELKSLDKQSRDEGIAKLRRAGLSIRQIERFTGIGRGIVSRVKWKE